MDFACLGLQICITHALLVRDTPKLGTTICLLQPGTSLLFKDWSGCWMWSVECCFTLRKWLYDVTRYWQEVGHVVVHVDPHHPNHACQTSSLQSAQYGENRPDTFVGEHLPSHVGSNYQMQWGQDPGADDEYEDELIIVIALTVRTAGLRCDMRSEVVRSFVCPAKFCQTSLETGYGSEINI